MPISPASTNLLAAILLPDAIPFRLELIILCSPIPTLIAALYGARITATPFRWSRIAGATFGVFIGSVLIPLALGLSMLVVNLCGPPLRLKPGGFEVHVIICSVTCSLPSAAAYFVGRIGRPACVAPNVMIETCCNNLFEINRIIQDELSQSGEVANPRLDVKAAQSAGILSHDQAWRLESILQLQAQMQHDNRLVHSDIELLAGTSSDLLDEIREQLWMNRKPPTVAKDTELHSPDCCNPYRPPGS